MTNMRFSWYFRNLAQQTWSKQPNMHCAIYSLWQISWILLCIQISFSTRETKQLWVGNLTSLLWNLWSFYTFVVYTRVHDTKIHQDIRYLQIQFSILYKSVVCYYLSKDWFFWNLNNTLLLMWNLKNYPKNTLINCMLAFGGLAWVWKIMGFFFVLSNIFEAHLVAQDRVDYFL